MPADRIYSDEPRDRQLFTEKFDHFYSRVANGYNWFVKLLPLWRNWLNHTVPHLQGERVIEISFGSGYLLTQYADRFMTCGIDLNKTLAQIAKVNVEAHRLHADLQIANVEALPYADETFDTLINTMSFTGYPDAHLALSEMRRVLKTGGRLVMIDINYPTGGNRLGVFLTRVWQYGGDIIRDMEPLFHQFGFQFTDEEIGGFGSVHLYVATKFPQPRKQNVVSRKNIIMLGGSNNRPGLDTLVSQHQGFYAGGGRNAAAWRVNTESHAYRGFKRPPKSFMKGNSPS